MKNPQEQLLDAIKNDAAEILFVQSKVTHSHRYYCTRCLYYGKGKTIKETTKPINTNCFFGTSGYYICVYKNEPSSVVSVLKINPAPKNCKECLLHIMTTEIGTSATDGRVFDCEVFSCAGHKGRGTLNPEFDFLNNYDEYSEGVASNCPLQIFTIVD